MKKLDKYFSSKRNIQVFSLFAVSVILILFCYSLLLTQKVNSLSNEIKNNNNFISSLQNQSRETKILLNATPEPTDNWKSYSVPEWKLTFKCPPKWNCTDLKIKNGYVTIFQSTTVDISFYLINAQTLNHPNYHRASDWLSDLILKKPITVEKIEGTQKPGYEGYRWPFYTDFELNSLAKIIVDDKVAAYTKNKISTNKVILVPWGNNILEVTSSNRDLTTSGFAAFISTIHME